MSKGSRLRFRQNNPTRTCSVPSCHKRRSYTSAYCCAHAKRAKLYGHPEARSIRSAHLASSQRRFAGFLQQHPNAPQLVAAVSFMDRLINLGTMPTTATERHLQRLKEQGLTGREALEVAGGVWLFAQDNPRTLPDDKRLTFAIGSALLKARPIASRQAYNRKHQKLERRYVAPAGGIRDELGGAIRKRLALFFTQVSAAMEADFTRNKELTLILAQPFPALAPL